MGTTHSSDETRGRAKDLAERIGAYHVDLNMDTAVSAVQGIFSLVTGKTPRFGSQGGTNAENLALQNIQVRFFHVVEGSPLADNRQQGDTTKSSFKPLGDQL